MRSQQKRTSVETARRSENDLERTTIHVVSVFFDHPTSVFMPPLLRATSDIVGAPGDGYRRPATSNHPVENALTK